MLAWKTLPSLLKVRSGSRLLWGSFSELRSFHFGMKAVSESKKNFWSLRIIKLEHIWEFFLWYNLENIGSLNIRRYLSEIFYTWKTCISHSIFSKSDLSNVKSWPSRTSMHVPTMSSVGHRKLGRNGQFWILHFKL